VIARDRVIAVIGELSLILNDLRNIQVNCGMQTQDPSAHRQPGSQDIPVKPGMHRDDDSFSQRRQRLARYSKLPAISCAVPRLFTRI
jgi:hypothetical protein